MLHEAGVTLLAGSDTREPYCPPGWALHQERRLVGGSGLSPADALAAATLHNAQAAKTDADLGNLTGGKIADIGILEADATSNVKNARKIHTIIHDGVGSVLSGG